MALARVHAGGGINPMSQDFDRARQEAEKCLAQGNFAQAEASYRYAAQIAETAFPAKDQRRCQMLSKLGESLSNQHKFSEAQQVLEQVITLKTEQFGPGNLEVANAMNDLAGLYYEQSRYREAVPICTKILNIYERILGKDHLDVATIAVNLAMLYHTQNLYDDAEPLYKRALDVRTIKLSAEHPDVINVLENYAALLLAMGRLDEAEYLKTCVMGRVSGRMRSTMHDIPAFKRSP